MPPRFPLAVLFFGVVRFAFAVDTLAPTQRGDLTPDPTVIWGTLDNGFRYAIRPNSTPKNRTHLQLLVLAGSYVETEAQRGYAHYVEHMAFSGTRLFPRDTLISVLQRHGMAFGPDLNANTFGDRTVYKLDLPTSGADQLKEAMQVLREFTDGVSFDPKEVERERGVVLQEKKMRDDWALRASSAYRSCAFPDSRLGDRPPLGVEEQILSATTESLRAFYTTWYRPDNIVLVAAGDFDPSILKQEIEEAFKTLPPPTTPRPAIDLGPAGNPAKLSVSLFDETDRTESTAFDLISTTAQPAIDTRAVRIERLWGVMAFDVFNTRLAVLQRTSKKITKAGADCNFFNTFAKTARIEVSSYGYDWNFAISTAEQELRRALQFGFTPAEIEEVRKKTAASVEHSSRSAVTRSSTDIASSIVDALVCDHVFTSPEVNTAIAREGLAQITPERFQQAFRAAWGTGSPRLFAAGKISRAHAAKDFAKAYRTSARRTVGPYVETALGKFAYTDFGPPGEIAKRDYVEDLNIHRVEFANGVRLNLKSTPFEASTIHYRARVGFGSTSEPLDQPGLRYLANGFLKLGLGRHDRTEIQHLSAGKIAWLEVSPLENNFGITGGSDGAGIERFFQLVAAFLTDPGWRKDAMPEIRGDVMRSFADMDNNALLALNGERVSRVASQDSRFQRTPIKKIQSYSLDQLRVWLEPQLKTAPLELGAVGDFDVEEMIELARRTIGCLPRRTLWPAPPAVKFIDHLSETVELPIASTNHHGAVQVTWALPAEHDHRTERTGELLAALLANRLETRIRRDMSATYSPRCNVSRSDFQPETGYLIASLTCGPSDAKRIGEIVEKIADELARAGVTQEELERARQPKLQSVPSLLRQNITWIGLVNIAQSQPEKLELARTRASDLESITVEDVNLFAAKTLLSARASLFITTPSRPKP